MPTNSLDNKRVFVTGGTGTIGSRVVRELLTRGAYVTVFSRDQNKQFVMDYELSSKRVTYKNGDICDFDLLSRVIEGHDYVVHCGASKHLPLCECNPDSAIKVNTEGTRNVLNACLSNGIKKFLLLSTDKAVNPSCVMGATKFLAERLALEYNSSFPCSVIRLGNVFASNGSVVPTFFDRIRHGLPLIVNNPNACRYFITQKEAGRFIVDRLDDMRGGEIFVKKMKFMTIQQLAECIVPNVGYPIKHGEMKPGEKMKETLVTQDESSNAWDMGDYICVSDGIDGKKLGLEIVKQFTNEEILSMIKELR